MGDRWCCHAQFANLVHSERELYLLESSLLLKSTFWRSHKQNLSTSVKEGASTPSGGVNSCSDARSSPWFQARGSVTRDKVISCTIERAWRSLNHICLDQSGAMKITLSFSPRTSKIPQGTAGREGIHTIVPLSVGGERQQKEMLDCTTFPEQKW